MATHDDAARNNESIGELGGLRRKPGADKRSPVVADYDALPIWLQELLPHADDKLRHGFENLVRSVVRQAVAATISRQINGNECMRLLQHRGLQDMSP